MAEQLSVPENAAALRALHRLLAEEGGSQSALARRLRCAQQTVNRALLLGRVGPVLAEWIASRGLRTTLGALVGPWPNRWWGAELCREDGVDEAAIQEVLDEPGPPDGDRSRLWWVDRMRLRAAQRARR